MIVGGEFVTVSAYCVRVGSIVGWTSRRVCMRVMCMSGIIVIALMID